MLRARWMKEWNGEGSLIVAHHEVGGMRTRSCAGWYLVRPYGPVALFETVDDPAVVIAAVRHQREDDCH